MSAAPGKITEIPRRRPDAHKVPFVYDPLPRTFADWAPSLTKTEILAYLFVVSKTWGFRKSSDLIATAQFLAAVQCSKPQLHRALQRLESLGLLKIRRAHRKISIYEALMPRKLGQSLGITDDTLT